MRFGPALLALGIIAVVALISNTYAPSDSVSAIEGNSIVSVDEDGDVGASTSIELDVDGNPVVSYRDISNNYLKLLHCGNPACTAGNTIARREVDASAGIGSSLALDPDGNPIVSYRDIANGNLRVLHCTDPGCLGGSTISSPAMMNFGMTSLALDAAANPVVSYTISGELQVIHCGNPTCTANNIIASPDPGIVSGEYRSLALSASGNPIVSYEDLTNNDLRVLHCGNPTCTSDNIIASPDTEGAVGHHNSLRLDPAGNPTWPESWQPSRRVHSPWAARPGSRGGGGRDYLRRRSQKSRLDDSALWAVHASPVDSPPVAAPPVDLPRPPSTKAAVCTSRCPETAARGNPAW